MGNDELDLSFIGVSEPYIGEKVTNKYTFTGVFVDQYFIDASQPVCKVQIPTKRTEMIKLTHKKLNNRNKYMPHQGKQECARRLKR